jgi:hypothetical protein
MKTEQSCTDEEELNLSGALRFGWAPPATTFGAAGLFLVGVLRMSKENKMATIIMRAPEHNAYYCSISLSIYVLLYLSCVGISGRQE